jgi:hypothetical protein
LRRYLHLWLIARSRKVVIYFLKSSHIAIKALERIAKSATS